MINNLVEFAEARAQNLTIQKRVEGNSWVTKTDFQLGKMPIELIEEYINCKVLRVKPKVVYYRAVMEKGGVLNLYSDYLPFVSFDRWSSNSTEIKHLFDCEKEESL